MHRYKARNRVAGRTTHSQALPQTTAVQICEFVDVCFNVCHLRVKKEHSAVLYSWIGCFTVIQQPKRVGWASEPLGWQLHICRSHILEGTSLQGGQEGTGRHNQNGITRWQLQQLHDLIR